MNLTPAWKKSVRYLKRSYSPYSHCSVSAALVTRRGKIYGGCNIENASYGGTVCAERVALWKAVSEGERDFVGIVVTIPEGSPWPPCGLCLQILSEFLSPKTPVALANRHGIQSTLRLQELLPQAFTSQFLSK